MNDAVISVENLGKKYLIGHQTLGRNSDETLRDAIVRGLKEFRRTTLDTISGKQIIRGDTVEEFWALKNVSFEIHRGDVIGIIGSNGAGKSTLLKILSRVTEPTEGRVKIKGRVASLLEVGTGFHPELSGRENIFLNGSILGMRQAEIRKNFDAIVDFSGIERFLDTPVKRYSSGMYVRLAFAVAAHLEPDVLVVDEVLAVGDAEFQKKCLGKMEDAGSQGRTVIFVSHNLGALRRLCKRGFVLQNGEISYVGDSASATDFYLRSTLAVARGCRGSANYPKDEQKAFQVLAVKLLNQAGNNTDLFDCDEPISIIIDCVSRSPIPHLYGYLALKHESGVTAWESDSLDMPPNQLDNLLTGRHQIRIVIPPRTLGRGEYAVYLSFASSQAEKGFLVDTPGNTVTFCLSDTATSRGDRRNGYLSTLLSWQVGPSVPLPETESVMSKCQ
jgi:lipopolysaccharide transport system ATP-binding protein